ncbi:MAG: polysaccharide deacetylase family protein [Phycisphaerae bacterium]|nr:polysaccharide deacetylase family protein [Phycisphaerae bacterium]
MVATDSSSVGNLLTVDLEDWYQLTGDLMAAAGRSHGNILARQLDRLLELLAKHECRATFFCLGKSLAPRPDLLKRVIGAGHEVATHGWEHRRIPRIGLRAFREDLIRSIAWLADLTGKPVTGHRAPAFSVPPQDLDEFYDICFDAGLAYDSSVFPYRREGLAAREIPSRPHIVRQNDQRRLIEFPVATVTWARRRWAVGGGGWWRLLPGSAIQSAVARLNRQGIPFTAYVHPYEFDTCFLNAVRAAGPSWRTVTWTLKQNLGRSSMYAKLDRLLTRFRFGAVEDHLRGAGLL